ncbi:alkaline phosphatase family protein [Pannonibacter tanglangensis]|nr:sulfatase [Pannonibacter sp. XCT-53]
MTDRETGQVAERDGKHQSAGAVGGAILLFAMIGGLAVIMPDDPGQYHPDALRSLAFLSLPLELPLLLAGLLLLPRRAAIALSLAAGLVLACLIFLKLADIGVLSAFQRRFNPYLDLKLLADGWNLFSGTVGRAGAAAAILGAATVLGLLVAAFLWSCLRLVHLGGRARRAVLAGAGLAFAGGLVLSFTVTRPDGTPLASLRAGPVLAERLALVVRSVADIRAFEAGLETPAPYAAGPDLLSAVAGRDVIVIFVESYGRSALEDPRYSRLTGPRLAAIEQRLAAEGFAMASGWAGSPTVAGLSWLAHATLMSGLWVDSQARHDLLMSSRRPSLNRLFSDAGWHAAAVMPAIVMDWPEAAHYGYDAIFDAKALDYRGLPFNWVTMPDQYTLSAFERRVRAPMRAAGTPVMAEIALISSHAPWTPVARLVDWAQVGDGTIFNDQAAAGDPPAVVWADPERVRQHYIATVDYSLETLGDYIARFGGEAVFVILGDHQPAALVTGPDASRAVPVHVISRDAGLVARFSADGFRPGLVPAADAPELPMDRLRGRLLHHFSGR